MATESDGQPPRAVIHKRILDEAEANPDASLAELAAEVPGASVALVERVLDEYGDPLDETSSPAHAAGEEPNQGDQPASESTDESVPAEQEDLSERQRSTLRKIKEQPAATQQEIGEALGVSAATISNRLSKIAGFDWQDRQQFVSGLFETPLMGDGRGQVEEAVPADVVDRLEQLEEQLTAMEPNTRGPLLPSELAHKVLHACMSSEEFSEEEELELIRALFGESDGHNQ